MFGMDLPCKLLPPKLVTVDQNHNTVRHVVVRLQTELTDELAAGIGATAQMARAALLDGSMRSTRLDIGAAVCVLAVGAVKLPAARGVRAAVAISKPKEDEEPAPQATLEFVAPWTDEALLGVAHATNQNVTARIERAQLSLLDKE